MDRLRSVVLRRCKSLSRAGSRRSSSSSYSNLRSMSARDDVVAGEDGEAASAVVFVGGSRRRYVISARHLRHPLIAALIDDDAGDGDARGGKAKEPVVAVRCEVVLFDHLLWMLDNAVDLRAGGEDDAVRELAQLYATR
ncbi:hypothetical protein ZWY2020_029743 [Hordeum vulgare]|nr:hypothetical protein ZWY2020_029743 [Hordeum vulgare]